MPKVKFALYHTFVIDVTIHWNGPNTATKFPMPINIALERVKKNNTLKIVIKEIKQSNMGTSGIKFKMQILRKIWGI
jgi:hypothetical protein